MERKQTVALEISKNGSLCLLIGLYAEHTLLESWDWGCLRLGLFTPFPTPVPAPIRRPSATDSTPKTPSTLFPQLPHPSHPPSSPRHASSPHSSPNPPPHTSQILRRPSARRGRPLPPGHWFVSGGVGVRVIALLSRRGAFPRGVRPEPVVVFAQWRL